MDSYEETKLAQFLVSRVCDKASGRNELECTHNYPRDVYFIGNLRPYRNEIDNQFEQNEHSQELPNKLALVAFGAEFLVHPKNKQL